MRTATVLALLLILTPVLAQDPGDRQRYAVLDRKVHEAFAAGDYETAAETCREQIEIAPDQPSSRYNLACALARLGETEEALASLAKAVERGFDDVGHIQRDPDLESLREAPAFAEILAAARRKREEAAAKLYEPGAEIEGVATFEGNPDGGLRWRVRIAKDASAEKPQRLIVWLHPSGGSMNKTVEALAPDLAAKSYALLLPTAKPWMSWSGEQARMLLDVSLPDAAKNVPGLSVERPLLLGFSAGGQMALNLWAEKPGRFGGLILDAAYPIDTAAYMQGRRETLALPEDEAIKSVPMFVLVGDEDGGHVFWKQVEEPWREAGIPLTVTYVPGGRHAWLLGIAQKTALLEWLKGLKGRRPAEESPAQKE